MQSIATRVFRGTRAILKYKKERDILLDNIRRYIVTLRSVPEGNYLIEIALNIQSLKVQADKVKWASQALVTNATAMKFVTSRGARYYLYIIPQACDEVGRCTRHLSDVLLGHIHQPVVNCEHDIAIELADALADLESHLD
ncbi:hypothetical protein N7447_006347 [Penicillium robsamsonii]|uniref:uncharacterized protein n=1 Tax=Penicillium robsamsonii TaxID=1792511 RepID=UPI0025465CE2|nr:uncharacterized protein N7447_006347 [Penicillium robsamsonii]KAJ5824007.1 hypothetical protein N7447_006347 [Penicillium robsamsonii]